MTVVAVLALLFGCDDIAELTVDEPEPTAPDFYSYVNDEGRTVYVSHPSMVPPADRGDAEAIDTSHVSLHEELGRELHEQLVREHRELSRSDACVEARDTAAASPIAHVWKRHGHLVAIGAVLLLLLLTAPWVGRRVGFPRWIRTLTFVVPILLLLGGITHLVVQASRSLREVRTTAELCDPDGFDDTEDGRRERHSVVSRLRDRVERAAELRQTRLDEGVPRGTR